MESVYIQTQETGREKGDKCMLLIYDNTAYCNRNHDFKHCEGKKLGKTHAPHLDAEMVRSFGNNMTDVITALNCIYVAEWTACEWVELLTLKKDVHVRLAIEMIEKVKKEGKTLRQMKSFVFGVTGKIRFAPGKWEHCHPPSYTQKHLQYKLYKA